MQTFASSTLTMAESDSLNLLIDSNRISTLVSLHYREQFAFRQQRSILRSIHLARILAFTCLFTFHIHGLGFVLSLGLLIDIHWLVAVFAFILAGISRGWSFLLLGRDLF